MPLRLMNQPDRYFCTTSIAGNQIFDAKDFAEYTQAASGEGIALGQDVLNNKLTRGVIKSLLSNFFNNEVVAKLASEVEFDDFFAGSIFRKLTYPIGHRRFARNSNPAKKARIRPRMEFRNHL